MEQRERKTPKKRPREISDDDKRKLSHSETNAPSNRARRVLLEETTVRARFAGRVGRAEALFVDAVSGTNWSGEEAKEE